MIDSFFMNTYINENIILIDYLLNTFFRFYFWQKL